MAELGVDRGLLGRGWLWIKYGGQIAAVGSVITAGAVVGGLIVHNTGSGGGSGSANLNTGSGGGSGSANLWIDTNGGSCARAAAPARYDDATACGTFATAYAAANPGDSIKIKTGSYAGETILFTLGLGKPNGFHCDWSSNSSLTNPIPDYSGCITFEPAPGATVSVQGLGVDVPYVRFRNMAFPGGISIGAEEPNSTGVGTCAALKVHDIVFDGITITNGTFFMAGDHTAIMNSTVDYGDTDLGLEKTAHIRECLDRDGVTVTRRSYMALIHNRLQNLIQTTNDGLHLEAVHGEAGQHVLLARNTFYNNAGHNLSAQCGVYHDNCADWLIQNNFFDEICSHQGATCTVQGGDGFSCSGGANRIDASIEFNTFLNHSPEYLLQQLDCTMSGTMIESGNLAESLYGDFHCSLYSTGTSGNPANSRVLINNYNVWYQRASGSPNPISQCGATNHVGGPAGFVDADAGDLHITAASSANNVVPPGSVTGGCPLLDIDGQARPQDTNCDAGADER